jgi:hypothetical protein
MLETRNSKTTQQNSRPLGLCVLLLLQIALFQNWRHKDTLE